MSPPAPSVIPNKAIVLSPKRCTRTPAAGPGIKGKQNLIYSGMYQREDLSQLVRCTNIEILCLFEDKGRF